MSAATIRCPVAVPACSPASDFLSDLGRREARLRYALRAAALANEEIIIAPEVSYDQPYRLEQPGLLKSSNALRKKLNPWTEIPRFLDATTD